VSDLKRQSTPKKIWALSIQSQKYIFVAFSLQFLLNSYSNDIRCHNNHYHIDLQLKDIAEVARVIDDVDDEEWLLMFIGELEQHLRDLIKEDSARQKVAEFNWEFGMLTLSNIFDCYQNFSTLSFINFGLAVQYETSKIPLRLYNHWRVSLEYPLTQYYLAKNCCYAVYLPVFIFSFFVD